MTDDIAGVYVVGPSTMVESGEQRATLENPQFSFRDPLAWAGTLGTSHATETGRNLTPGDAITYSPVWQAIGMISADVAKIPLEVRRRTGEQDSAPDFRHPAYRLVNAMANPLTPAFYFWRDLLAGALLYSNAYAWIEKRGSTPVGLYLLLPDRTYCEEIDGRRIVRTEIGDRQEVFDYSEVLHIRGFAFDGKTAPDLVIKARHDISVGLESRGFTAQFFKNKAAIGGVLIPPPGTKKEVRDKVEQGFTRRYSDEAFRTAMLREGWRWQATMANPTEADVTQIDEAEVRHIARFFNLRPSRLGVPDSVSYNSLAEDRRDYSDSTLSAWWSAIRGECDSKLLSGMDLQRRRRWFQYEMSALRYADVSTLASMGTQLVGAGIADRNEIRRWFGWSPQEAPPDPEPPNPLAADSVAGDDAVDPEGDEMRAALERCMEDAVDRARRRIAIQATRRAKECKPGPEGRGRFLSWLDELEKRHGQAVEAIFSPAAQAMEAAGLPSVKAYEFFQSVDRELRSIASQASDQEFVGQIEHWG